MKLSKQLINVLLVLLFSLFCLLITVSGWLTYTESGLQQLTQFTTKLIPGLSFTKPSGSLLSSARFESIYWQQDGLTVEVENVAVDLSPECLLGLSLCVDELTASAIYITTFSEQSADQVQIELSNIELPFDLSIAKTQIKRFVISSDREERLSVVDVSLNQFLLQGSELTVNLLQATLFDEVFTATIKLTLDGDYPLAADIDLKTSQLNFLNDYVSRPQPENPEATKHKLQLSLTGTLRTLQAGFSVQGPLQLTGEAEIKPLDLLSPFSMFVQLTDQAIVNQLEQLVDIAQAEVWLTGNTEKIDFKLAATMDVPPIEGVSSLLVSGSSNYQSVDIESSDLSTTKGHLSVTGKLHLDNVKSSVFSISGNNINTDVIDPQYIGNLNLAAKLTLNKILSDPELTVVLTSLDGQFLNKPLVTTGSFIWRSDFHLNFNDFVLANDFFTVKVDGEYPSQSLEWTASINQLSNIRPELKGKFNASGKLYGAIEQPSISANILVVDFTAAGITAQRLVADIDINKMGWLPSDIVVQAQAVKSSSFSEDINLVFSIAGEQKGQEHRNHFFLLGEKLALTTSVKVDGAGDWQAMFNCNPNLDIQTLDLDVACPLLTAALIEPLKSDVHLDDVEHTSPDPKDITQSDKHVEASSNWANNNPIKFEWKQSAQHLAIESFCIKSTESAFCLNDDLSWGPDNKAGLNFSGDHLPLAWLSYFAPGSFNYLGHWAFTAVLEEREAIVVSEQTIGWQLRGKIGSKGAGLIKNLDQDQLVNVPIENIDMNFLASSSGFESTFKFQSSKLGTIDGLINYSNEALTGSIQAIDLDVQIAQGFIPDAQRFTGSFSTDIKFNLSNKAFNLNGVADLKNIDFSSRTLPFELTDGNAHFDFDNSLVSVVGDMDVGGGKAVIDGQLEWLEEGLRTSVKLKGDNITINPLPHSTITLAPDILLTTETGRIDISGELFIPEANIEIQSLAKNAIAESEDAIIESEAADDDFIAISTNINTVLGEQVKFSGFGLDTLLTGNLKIAKQPRQLLAGNGVISLKDGRFQAYGQNLEIEEGRMIFNGPLTNPALSITAIRKRTEDDVRVGVEVTGSAKDLQVALFSTPTKTENEILSYLLTGKPPQNTSGDQSRLAQQMAISLGMAGTNSTAKDVAESVGIQDFRMGTDLGRDGEEAQVSGYVSPNLYLLYGVSMFDRSSSVTARYDLSSRYYVEVYSGAASAIDIFWSITR